MEYPVANGMVYLLEHQRSMTFSERYLVSYPPSERSSSDNFTLVDDPNLSIANAVPAAIFKTDHDEEVKAEADALEDKGVNNKAYMIFT